MLRIVVHRSRLLNNATKLIPIRPIKINVVSGLLINRSQPFVTVAKPIVEKSHGKSKMSYNSTNHLLVLIETTMARIQKDKMDIDKMNKYYKIIEETANMELMKWDEHKNFSNHNECIYLARLQMLFRDLENGSNEDIVQRLVTFEWIFRNGYPYEECCLQLIFNKNITDFKKINSRNIGKLVQNVKEWSDKQGNKDIYFQRFHEHLAKKLLTNLDNYINSKINDTYYTTENSWKLTNVLLNLSQTCEKYGENERQLNYLKNIIDTKDSTYSYDDIKSINSLKITALIKYGSILINTDYALTISYFNKALQLESGKYINTVDEIYKLSNDDSIIDQLDIQLVSLGNVKYLYEKASKNLSDHKNKIILENIAQLTNDEKQFDVFEGSEWMKHELMMTYRKYSYMARMDLIMSAIEKGIIVNPSLIQSITESTENPADYDYFLWILNNKTISHFNASKINESENNIMLYLHFDPSKPNIDKDLIFPYQRTNISYDVQLMISKLDKWTAKSGENEQKYFQQFYDMISPILLEKLTKIATVQCDCSYKISCVYKNNISSPDNEKLQRKYLLMTLDNKLAHHYRKDVIVNALIDYASLCLKTEPEKAIEYFNKAIIIGGELHKSDEVSNKISKIMISCDSKTYDIFSKMIYDKIKK